jgi:hypothetical protein
MIARMGAGRGSIRLPFAAGKTRAAWWRESIA